MKLNELLVAVQTVYADLVKRAWSGDLAQLTTGPVTPYKREAGAR